MRCLLAIVGSLLAMVDQNLEDDLFCHALREVGIDHAYDRQGGQIGL